MNAFEFMMNSRTKSSNIETHPYQCPECKKRFMSRTKFRQHFGYFRNKVKDVKHNKPTPNIRLSCSKGKVLSEKDMKINHEFDLIEELIEELYTTN